MKENKDSCLLLDFEDFYLNEIIKKHRNSIISRPSFCFMEEVRDKLRKYVGKENQVA